MTRKLAIMVWNRQFEVSSAVLFQLLLKGFDSIAINFELGVLDRWGDATLRNLLSFCHGERRQNRCRKLMIEQEHHIYHIKDY